MVRYCEKKKKLYVSLSPKEKKQRQKLATNLRSELLHHNSLTSLKNPITTNAKLINTSVDMVKRQLDTLSQEQQALRERL